MKRVSLVFAALLSLISAVSVQAQDSPAPEVVYRTGAPASNACGEGKIIVDRVTGVAYVRVAGVCQAIGGGGGVTNSATANNLPKSDGTNLVASRITDTGSLINIGNATMRVHVNDANNVISIGDIIGADNSTKLLIDDTNELFTFNKPVTVGGLVWSTTGGFKFPDNTTQTTAATATTNASLLTSGTVAAARLPSTTVNSVVNDTNVTGSIAGQALTFGWSGALAKARQHAATVYNDQANTFAGTQTIGSGNLALTDATPTIFATASGASLKIGQSNASGSGIVFHTRGADRWTFSGPGHLTATTDNAYQIGNGSNADPSAIFGVILSARASLKLNGVLTDSVTAPTVSGFGTSPSVPNNNGTAAFEINVGTGGTANTGTITLPAAAHGWVCVAQDVTNPDSFVTAQTGGTTTTATLKNYSRTTGAAIAWTASDILRVLCRAY